MKKSFKRIISLAISMVIGCTMMLQPSSAMGVDESSTNSAIQHTLNNYIVPDGETLIYRKIVEQNEDGYVIETLTMSNDINTLKLLRYASGNIEYTKSYQSTDLVGNVIGTAYLTAVFSFNEQNNMVDIRSSDYWFEYDGTDYFTNPRVTYSYKSGTPYKGTVKLYFVQNAFLVSSKSISITCNSKGIVS